MAPHFVRGKAIRQTAAAAARRWQRTPFAHLVRALDGGLRGQMVLPVSTATNSTSRKPADPTPASPPCLTVSTTVNHAGLAADLKEQLNVFWQPDESGSAGAHSHAPLVTRDVFLCAGPPPELGLPQSVEIEKANWSEAVMRGEAYSYNHFFDGGRSAGDGSVAPSPVRWLTQQMRDGFVSCRVDAHAGVTSASMLHARETAKHFGRHLPPFDVSPYYGANELLDQWCLFGEEDRIRRARHLHGGAGDHVHHVLELALGSALLPMFHGLWLNASVLAHKTTGHAVVILGPPRSGKTTLALHCLSASPNLSLVASEHVFVCDGAQLPPFLLDESSSAARGPPRPFLFASVPGKTGVGVGALLGTLRSNPLLTSRLTGPAVELLGSERTARHLLQNSDGVLWNMAERYPVDLVASGDGEESRWNPAGVFALRGVVLLDWDVGELYSTSPARAQTVARRILPEDAASQWDRHVEPLLEDWGTIRDHYLLRSVYDAKDGRTMSDLLGASLTDPATVLARLQGAVNFDLGVSVICNLLKP